MNLINHIEEVGHSFIELQDKIVYISKYGDCDIFNVHGEKLNSIDGNFAKLDCYSPYEFYLGFDFQSKIVNIEDKVIIDYPFMIQDCDKLRNLCSYRKEGKRYFASVLKSGQIEWERQIKTGKFIKLFKRNFLNSKYLTDSFIGLYSCLTGDELWTFDTTTLGIWIDYDKTEKTTEVQRVLGELDDKLYIYLNNGKILILNLLTGDKIDLLENDKNTDQGSFKGRFMSAIQLDKKYSKLIQLFNQRYTEVDIQNKTVSQIHIEDMIRNNLTNMNGFVFDDDLIYFSDRNECKVATLNRKTMQIDWVHTFYENESCEIGGNRFGRDLKLSGHRLYVLDNKHTLHVFEKENA